MAGVRRRWFGARAADSTRDALALAQLRSERVEAARRAAQAARFEQHGAVLARAGRALDCWADEQGAVALHVSDGFYLFLTRLADGRWILTWSHTAPATVGHARVLSRAGGGSFQGDLAAHRAAVQRAGAAPRPFQGLTDHVDALDSLELPELALLPPGVALGGLALLGPFLVPFLLVAGGPVRGLVCGLVMLGGLLLLGFLEGLLRRGRRAAEMERALARPAPRIVREAATAAW